MAYVVLCVCTCRRPEGLRCLLEATAGIEFAGELSVVVVDNDVRQDGRAVCREIGEDYPWPLQHVHEPRRGISFARNHAVRLALRQQPDFIAMLDDDEWPSPRWLDELLRVQTQYAADVVGAAHLPVFPDDDRSWSSLADYYGSDLKKPDGTQCILYSAGNFLARTECFRALWPTPFDPDFAISGGEDMMFFRVLSEKGYQMRWSARGVVYESVPRDRLNRAWLRSRQRRLGNTNVRIQRRFEPGFVSESLRVAKTAGLLVIGGMSFLIFWPHRTLRIKSDLLLNKALGKVKGHLGQRCLEYTGVTPGCRVDSTRETTGEN